MVAEATAALRSVWIVGPGRLGLALGLALWSRSAAERISVSGRRPHPPEHPLFAGHRSRATYSPVDSPPEDPEVVLLTVPDERIAALADRLARGVLAAGVPVLHASGAYGAELLQPLRERGHPVGSVHPLAAISDPVAGAEALQGAWFAVEGDEAARGIAGRIVALLGGQALPVLEGAKPVYHAAAVFASNYLVALLAVAERLMGQSGVPPHLARASLARLADGAVAAAAARGTASALTGPVSRGDVQTLRLHLGRLSPPDATLYCVLARATLEVAAAQGLDPQSIERIESLLAEAT